MSGALSVGLNVANMECIGNLYADFDYFKLYSTPLQPTTAPTEYPSTSPTPTPSTILATTSTTTSTSGQPTPTPTTPVPQPLMASSLTYLGGGLGAVFIPAFIGLLFLRRKRRRSSMQTATIGCISTLWRKRHCKRELALKTPQNKTTMQYYLIT